jgi:hypothetical protein
MTYPIAWNRPKLIEEGLCAEQSWYIIIEQPADWPKKLTSRLCSILQAPHPRKAGRRLQFPKSCILPPRQGESLLKAEFCFLPIRLTHG